LNSGDAFLLVAPGAK
jgi:gelsolin